MDLPGLIFRPGKVIEAEIHRKFNSTVCAPNPLAGFRLVASFGRCKFRLIEKSVACILQATIGGSAPLFYVQLLNDRVFAFVVNSKAVGFHVCKLRNFECACYKIFFNLWQNGGHDFIRKYKLWCFEEQASWKKVENKVGASSSSKPVRSPLTGANLIPVSTSRSMEDLNFKKPYVSELQYVSKHPKISDHSSSHSNFKPNSSALVGVLGPAPTHMNGKGSSRPPIDLCYKCLSPAHSRSQCTLPFRCRRCL